MFGLAMMLAAAAPATAERPQVRAGIPVASAMVGSEPLGSDRKGRPTISVRINGRGPFSMVLDTAAQVSLVTAGLATELKLPALDGSVGVAGATGVGTAALYGVDRLSSGLFDARSVGLPVLPESGVTDARGIVGMDNFVGRKLTIDRQAARADVGPSGPAAPGFVAVKGQANGEGLLSVPVTINGRTVEALVDSGAEGTIATPALLDLLGWAPDDKRLKDYGTMRGAAGANRAVRVATMDTLAIGPVRLSNVPVVIAGEGAETGIILGSDILNLLRAYAVDPVLGELQIRIPGPAATPAR